MKQTVKARRVGSSLVVTIPARIRGEWRLDPGTYLSGELVGDLTHRWLEIRKEQGVSHDRTGQRSDAPKSAAQFAA